MSGSHSSSDDSSDSRKRPSDQELDPDSSPKRANCDENVHLKILVPSIAAGAVIGKSGEAIGRIQKETNTKVKISKQDEFYPGTTERVCLIVGSLNGVMTVHNYIMDRVMEKPDPNPHATGEGRLNVERHKQVKILVPNSTAGMVIGKGGAYIQEIKEKTGAYVQISQKSREYNLLERCIVIAGELDQTRAAVHLILEVIAADPQSASCPNLSYHDVQGPVASVYPTGSPYATPILPCSNLPVVALTNPSQVDPNSAAAAAAAATMMAAAFNPVTYPIRNASTFGFFTSSNYAPTPDLLSSNALAAALASVSNASPFLVPQLLSSQIFSSPGTAQPIPGDLMASSWTPAGPSSVLDPSGSIAAQQAALLASFGSKPVGDSQSLRPSASPPVFLPQSSLVPDSNLMNTRFIQQQQQQRQQSPLAIQTHLVSPSSSQSSPITTAPSLLGLYALQNSMPTSSIAIPMGNLMTYRHVIAVPENMIGLILGPQGRAIMDLQLTTNTLIQISQKGVYLPNTQNRTVTITGAQANVQWAASLIEQTIRTEQLRRETHLIHPYGVASTSTTLPTTVTTTSGSSTSSINMPTMIPSLASRISVPSGLDTTISSILTYDPVCCTSTSISSISAPQLTSSISAFQSDQLSSASSTLLLGISSVTSSSSSLSPIVITPSTVSTPTNPRTCSATSTKSKQFACSTSKSLPTTCSGTSKHV